MITTQLEKVFFNYVKENKKYFSLVKPYFFRNNEIQFVYEILRNYMLESTESKVPSPRQILDMVQLEDKEGRITKAILKSILDIDLNEYSEMDFIEPRFNAWILSNRLKAGTSDVVEETRNLDNVSDYESAVQAANRIKDIVDEMASTKFISDDDLGLDFDDPDSHSQDTAGSKISSGYETIDHILGKGWDVGTLNILMGETNSGKCSAYDTKITLRIGKKNEKIKLYDFFTKIRKGHHNT